MKYQQATDFEKQLIKLYYCQGIGLQGCWKIIWHWLETKEMNCSLEEMIAIGVLPQHRAVFRRSWERLTDEHIAQKMGAQNYLTFFSSISKYSGLTAKSIKASFIARRLA